VTSKPTVKLKTFKEIYAACKYGWMNCTVTELIVLTFRIKILYSDRVGRGGLTLKTFNIWNSHYVNMPIPFPKDYRFQVHVTKIITY
jgi:hypothetical protein